MRSSIRFAPAVAGAPLEQRVDGEPGPEAPADLGTGLSVAIDGHDLGLADPEHALDVEAVAAVLEGRERRVGEAADQRRWHLRTAERRLGSPVDWLGRRAGLTRCEQLGSRARSRLAHPDAQPSGRIAVAGGRESRPRRSVASPSSSERISCSAIGLRASISFFKAFAAEGAAEDAAGASPGWRRRRRVAPPPRRRARRPARSAPGSRAGARPGRPRRPSWTPTRASSPPSGPSSSGFALASGDQPSCRFRPRSATATTSNSSPLAPCTVITRTPAWPSARVAASASRSRLVARDVEVLEEAAEVRSLAGLELARQPHQLAHVRPACLPVDPAQRRQVVVEGRGAVRSTSVSRPPSVERIAQLGEDAGEAIEPLELLGGNQRRGLGVPAARLVPFSTRSRTSGQMWPEALAVLSSSCHGRRPPQQPERVGEDAAGGGGERPEERLVVERIGDHREQTAQVVDLLLGPEAATADDVGIEARRP